MSSNGMGLVEAVAAIRDGSLSSVELVQDCLTRINEHEETIGAWVHLNDASVLEQAETRDQIRAQGQPVGPLHGIPIGIKDIIDTAFMPTEMGTPLYQGHVPHKDAVVVERLRNAGAIIMGKTVTAEMACNKPGKTTNPHNPTHSPGGSSSGSAAAVASFMVPGALGTQTVGSVVRPASFCGVFGFKPTYGQIPRTGILKESPFLDHVGTFARSIEDIALLTQVLTGPHAEDTATNPLGQQQDFLSVATSDVLFPPKLAFIKGPVWNQGSPDLDGIFNELCDVMGEHIDVITLPSEFDDILEWVETISRVEIAKNFEKEYNAGVGGLSDQLRQDIEHGQQINAVDYLKAQDHRTTLNGYLEDLFDGYDAIITSSSPGEAPASLETTGNAAFNAMWSYSGAPALNIPALQGLNEMPVGIQAIGNLNNDARLLRTANWILTELGL